MMKRKALSALVALAAVPFIAQASKASVTFLYVGVPSPSTVPAGSSTSAEIYLQETLTSGSADVVTANNGLFSAGVALSITGHTGGSQATITNFSGDSSFTGPIDPVFNTGSASLTEGTGLLDTSGPLGSTTTVSGTVTRLIPLGSLSILTNAAGTTTFTVGEFDTLHGNTLDFSGNDYDTNNSNPAYTGVGTSTSTFVVTASPVAIPEPAAAIGMMVLSGGLLLSRWRGKNIPALTA
jgi:hypothetical protein